MRISPLPSRAPRAPSCTHSGGGSFSAESGPGWRSALRSDIRAVPTKSSLPPVRPSASQHSRTISGASSSGGSHTCIRSVSYHAGKTVSGCTAERSSPERPRALTPPRLHTTYASSTPSLSSAGSFRPRKRWTRSSYPVSSVRGGISGGGHGGRGTGAVVPPEERISSSPSASPSATDSSSDGIGLSPSVAAVGLSTRHAGMKASPRSSSSSGS